MTAPATPPPAQPRTADRVRSFLSYAFLISLLIHAVVLPFFGLKKHIDQTEKEQKVTVEKIKVRVPTPPPPTPTPPPPTPTPKPQKQTPPPVKQTNPPPPKPLLVKPPKTTSNKPGASTEKTYIPPKNGDAKGAPGGTGKATAGPVTTAAPVKVGPVATAAPPPPPPPPTPTPTPLAPKCAVPNVEPTTLNAAEADYPDIARQQGVVGTAAVKVTLDAGGHVGGAEISKSAGNAALDQAAVKAARASTYKAEVVNCVPTAGSYLFRVDFTGQ